MGSQDTYMACFAEAADDFGGGVDNPSTRFMRIDRWQVVLVGWYAAPWPKLHCGGQHHQVAALGKAILRLQGIFIYRFKTV